MNRNRSSITAGVDSENRAEGTAHGNSFRLAEGVGTESEETVFQIEQRYFDDIVDVDGDIVMAMNCGVGEGSGKGRGFANPDGFGVGVTLEEAADDVMKSSSDGGVGEFSVHLGDVTIGSKEMFMR